MGCSRMVDINEYFSTKLQAEMDFVKSETDSTKSTQDRYWSSAHLNDPWPVMGLRSGSAGW